MVTPIDAANKVLRDQIRSYTNNLKDDNLSMRAFRTTLEDVEADQRLHILKSQFNQGQTILHSAASKGKEKLITCILDAVAQSTLYELLCIQDEAGLTPLHCVGKNHYLYAKSFGMHRLGLTAHCSLINFPVRT